MTDLITFSDSSTITLADVRDSIDRKSLKAVSDEALIRVAKDVEIYIKAQTDITKYNLDLVKAAIYAMIRWQAYMLYIEGISDVVTNQSPRISESRIGRFKELASIYLSKIDIRLEQQSQRGMKLVGAMLSDDKSRTES